MAGYGYGQIRLELEFVFTLPNQTAGSIDDGQVWFGAAEYLVSPPSPLPPPLHCPIKDRE